MPADFDIGTPEPSAAEVDMALVDVECQKSTDLVRVWFEVDSELQAALAGAGEARLREVAAQWSRIEEFTWADEEPPDLTHALAELAALARAATDRGDRLYCWICV